jgi:hypothetical protein
MLTFLVPGFLYAAGAVALGVVALHFLVTQQPRTDVLPTVRFFPDVLARSTSLAIRPSDFLLLAVRVLAILLIGAAFAQPLFSPTHHTVARLVAVDVSGSVGDHAKLADSARAYIADVAAVVLFDSAAHDVSRQAAADSLRAFAARSSTRVSLAAPGRLSPALIALLRAAARVRDEADSLELVVISPLVGEEGDAATLAIRSLWPGHLLPVRVAAATSAAQQPANDRRVALEWADSGTSTLWVPRSSVDTIGGVRAGDNVLVYPFARRWRLKEGAATSSTTSRVYARWMDGEPAALERLSAGGCVRSIAFTLPDVGDAALRPEFMRFVQGLSAPCGTRRDLALLSTEFMKAFEGPSRLAPARSIQPRVIKTTPLVPWLLAAAILLLLAELLVRRRSVSREDAIDDTVNVTQRAA